MMRSAQSVQVNGNEVLNQLLLGKNGHVEHTYGTISLFKIDRVVSVDNFDVFCPNISRIDLVHWRKQEVKDPGTIGR